MHSFLVLNLARALKLTKGHSGKKYFQAYKLLYLLQGPIYQMIFCLLKKSKINFEDFCCIIIHTVTASIWNAAYVLLLAVPDQDWFQDN